MKKRISTLLTAAIVISSIPVGVFAASDNSINKVPMVSEGHVFNDKNQAPILRIEEKREGEITTGSAFRISLNNAEFTFDDEVSDSGTVKSDITKAFDTAAHKSGFEYEITRITDSMVSVEIKDLTSYYNPAKKNVIEIPLFTEITGTGKAEVTIDAMNSMVSDGTFAFANGSDSKTKASVDKSLVLNESRLQRAGTILIDEMTVGALKKTDEKNDREYQGFKLRLPSGFTWDEDTLIRFSGLNEANVEKEITADGRDLVVKFDITQTSSGRGMISVTPWINVSRNASFGDVDVSMIGYGDIENADDLVIAEYLDYGAAIKVEKDGKKEFYPGRLFDNKDNAYSVEFTIKEDVSGSFLPNRSLDFEFPDSMWILDVVGKDDAKKDSKSITLDEDGDNEFSYRINKGDSKLTFEVFFTLDSKAIASESKTLEMLISGAGLDEEKVTIGTIKSPVEVKVQEQTKEIKSGTHKQDAPEIVITETAAGTLMEKGMLELKFENTFGNGIMFDSFDVEVTEGDVEIKNAKVSNDGSMIQLEVKGQSKKASSIKFKNIKITTNRVIPKGEYNLLVGGTALVNNTEDSVEKNSYRFSGVNSDAKIKDVLKEAKLKEYVAKGVYVLIDTPIAGAETEAPTAKAIMMSIGQPFYAVDGELLPMDAAPYIQNGRTMVPVKYVAQALGVKEESIIWNKTARTVTILGEKAIQLTIDSNEMIVNGETVQMDAVAEITGDRTFVPVSRLAWALGVDYSWDAENQIATFSPQSK